MTKTFKNQAAQGDVMFIRVDILPEGLAKLKSENGKFVVAHSETGHNHIIREDKGISFYANDNDKTFTAYLVVDNTKCLVEHERSFDTHESIQIDNGIYKVVRQREYTPEGLRRAQD